jgi:hypothetical protein
MTTHETATHSEGTESVSLMEPPEADVVEWGNGMVVYSGSESTAEWMKVSKDSLVSIDDWR